MATSYESINPDEVPVGDYAFADAEEGPSQAEQLDQMAQDGNVQDIWRYLSSAFERTFLGACWDILDLEKSLQCLTRACEVSARANPAKFASQMHTQMVGITSALTMRLQFHLLGLMSEHDQKVRKSGASEITAAMFSNLMPEIAEVQRTLAEMFQLQAQTARLWELTNEKRASNKRRWRPTQSQGRSDAGRKS